MNLPGDDQTDITSSLYDDSIKGDLAFQMLYLGGLPIEEGGKTFTKQQQTDLRRIFRAVFGPRQRILPTASQVKTLARMAVGKKGQAMPSKPPVFQLPCDDKDRDLMIKALQIRRVKLIEQIQNYDKLKISDIHGRYMRDHLKKLSDLLDNQIIEAKKTKRGCRYTGVIDPNASNPMPLSDERMHRLLEIFAFLLAQGKDPLRALSGRLPAPSTIIPLMANADAPDIYEYEESFGKERDGKTPDYTPTLIKLRKVLQEDEGLGRVVINEELKKTVEEAERELFPTDPNRSSGTFTERKQRILNYLKEKQQEINEATANKIKCDTTIAGLRIEVDKSKAALDKCLAEKKTCEDKLGPIQTEIDSYKAKILELEKAKEASDKATQAEKADTLRKHTTRITQLTQERKALAEEVDAAAEREKILNKELTTAKAKIQALEAGSASGAAVAAKSNPADAAKIASLEGQLVALRNELAEARASGAAESPECAAKQAEIDDLTARLRTTTESFTTAATTARTLREKINELLRAAGFTGANDLIEVGAAPDRIRERINTLSAKYSGLKDAAEAAAAGSAAVAPNTMICLLNLIYHFFKKAYSSNDDAIEMFQMLEGKSQRSDFLKDDSILDIFNILVQYFKPMNQDWFPDNEDSVNMKKPIIGLIEDDRLERIYQTAFAKLIDLDKKPTVFPPKVLTNASNILQGFLPPRDTEIDFSKIYIASDGHMYYSDIKPSDKINFASCFLYVLALAHNFIFKNMAGLRNMGCDIINNI